MLEIVDKLEQRLSQVDQELVDPENLSDRKKLIELNRERRRIEEILIAGKQYRQLKTGIEEAQQIIKEAEDDELVTMAREELAEYEGKIEQAELDFKFKLLPHDPTDDKSAVVEIRAGTGGDEAGLFAGDIFRMYQRFADKHSWKLEILNTSESGSGGFKEIIFSLDGDGAYGTMKYESGVHRVQRVPSTETQGRIHTSAVTVGGQSVNTTDSAVRITHIPTGLVVSCQDEKSQLKNKNKAMKVLRARLYDKMMSEQNAKIKEERRSMVSTGDRSAKIRTYNFPQGRVTDHRISLSLYKLGEILAGDVDHLVEPLKRHDQEEQLKLAGTAAHGATK